MPGSRVRVPPLLLVLAAGLRVSETGRRCSRPGTNPMLGRPNDWRYWAPVRYCLVNTPVTAKPFSMLLIVIALLAIVPVADESVTPSVNVIDVPERA